MKLEPLNKNAKILNFSRKYFLMEINFEGNDTSFIRVIETKDASVSEGYKLKI